MTLMRGSCTAEVDVPIERCWELVQDVARAPEWQRVLERVDVITRDPQGRPLICDTVNDAKLTKVHCRVRMRYEAPRRMSFTRVESDDVDFMEGGWELQELGSGRTRATYSLAVDPGPIGILARPLERIIRSFVIGHQADELATALASEP
jgi:ribosome-associated toxin RatA of RatAB toxin-antitoxin module